MLHLSNPNVALIAFISIAIAHLGQLTAVNAQDVPDDFQKRLGTNSRQAAAEFQQGIKTFQGSSFQKSVGHFKASLKHDPGFQLGMYWLSQAYEATGNHSEEMQVYEQLYETRKAEINSVVIEGCINAGLAEGKRGKLESSSLWFGRSLALDPKNRFKKSAQAYRNLAITKFRENDFTSAAVVASLGNKIDSKLVPMDMFDNAAKKARREVATVLETTPAEKLKFSYRDTLGIGESAVEIPEISENYGQIVDVYTKNKLVVLPNEGKFIWVVDYSAKPKTKKVKIQGRPRAATFVDGRLFISLTSPHRIAEFDIDSDKETRSWALTEAAPTSIAVAPAKSIAFLCSKSVIRILDLKSGKQTLSDFEATGVASDPQQEFLFAFRTPPSQTNVQRGHFLVKGRPIFFTIEDSDFDWSQSTLLRFLITDKQLMLSQVRINAASNAKSLHVSPDGRIVSLVGGGGWRPNDSASGSGYGVPFLNARDFSHVLRFVKTDAYPQTAAISPVNHLIFAGGGQSVLSHIVNDDNQELSIPEKTTTSMFSGDGRWLFLGSGSKLYSFPLKLSAQDRENQSWYKK